MYKSIGRVENAYFFESVVLGWYKDRTGKRHFFIFSHWGIGQSRKIKTITQVSHTSQHGMSHGSKAYCGATKALPV